MARNALIDPATKMLYPDLYIGGGGGGQVNSLTGGAGINIAGTVAIPQVNLAFTAAVGEIMVGTGALAGAPLAPVLNGILSGVGGTPSYIVPGANNEVLKIVGGVPQFAVAATAGLGEVLQVNNSAATPVGAIPQNATDFNTLGCVKIETGTVGQGNNLALVVGEAGDNLQIKGGTLLGSILAGNGANTEGLVAGANGLVLTANSGAPLGVEWAANGTGTLTSITAGSNIGVNNAIPAAPVVSLLNPLTSTLNLGTQSITGTTSNITLSSGTNQANMNGNLGFTSAVQATPTTKANLFNTSISIETATNKVIIQPTQILKSVGSSTFTIGSAVAPLSLIGNGGAFDGIQIQQAANTGTTLTTNLSNVKFYPEYYVDNQNSNTVNVPLPQMDYQRLTLNNLGLTNTNTWSDYGNNVYSGYSAFTIDGAGNYWYAAEGSGDIQVIDSTFNLVATLQLTDSGNPGTINCFYQQGGFMWIGGKFSSVQDANGINATPQFSITRINSSSYLCDPTYDGAGSIYGAFPSTEVFCIADVNGVIAYGGNFLNFSNGSTCNNIAQISSPYAASGSQLYTEFAGGVNSPVFAIHHESFLNYTFVGGDFTSVNVSVSPQSYYYCSYYDNGISTWNSVAFNNINNVVRVIKSTPYNQLFVAGSFGQISGTGQNYNTYIEPATPNNWSDTTLSLGSPVDYKQAYYSGEIGVWDTAGNAFQKSSAYQVWTSLGDPTGSGTLTGVNYSVSWKVIYSTYNKIRQHGTLPHSCEFNGSFIYDATAYTKYTITPRNVSQQFIGDINNSYWSIIGQGVGTFS